MASYLLELVEKDVCFVSPFLCENDVCTKCDGPQLKRKLFSRKKINQNFFNLSNCNVVIIVIQCPPLNWIKDISIIESAAYCNQNLLAHLYLNSTQHT